MKNLYVPCAVQKCWLKGREEGEEKSPALIYLNLDYDWVTVIVDIKQYVLKYVK